MEVDADYEFNAPKYIDFLSNETENEYIDTWFDENPDGHEGGIRISQVPFICHHSNFQAATRAITAALTESDETVNKEYETSSDANNDTPVVYTSTNKTNIAPDEGSKSTERIETQEGASVQNVNGNADRAVEMPEDNDRKFESNVTGDTSNCNEIKENDIKMVTRSQTPHQGKRTPLSALRKRKHSVNQKVSTTGKKSKENDDKKSEAKKQKLDVKRPLITMPNTPSFLRKLRGKSSSDKRTSEAIEIERIKRLQDETKKMLKKNESSLQKTLAPLTALQPKRAVDVTRTMEFTFATDARIKQHPMKTRSERPASGDFVGQLRKHPPSPNFKNKKPTKPEPFKFLSGGKMTKSKQSEWKSMASSVNDFQNKTPDRWRTRPLNEQNVGPDLCNKSKTKLEITHPKTPQLTAKNRSRPVTLPSHAELEGKIVEEMANYKFKARAFDHKLVEQNGMSGVDPMKQLPVTEPKAFSFQSDARLEHRRKHEEEKREKEQIMKQQDQQEKGNEKRSTSIDSGCPGKKKPRVTEPKPFSFESRDKEMIQKKQEKIQKAHEEEEKAREFHARPLPSLSPDLVPVKMGKHTDTAPFKLATDERGVVKEEKWVSQLMHEREVVKEMAGFKARPCKVVHQESFKVKPAPRPLTEISEFKLNTEERSRKRESYEIMKKELQRVKEDEMQQSAKERQEEEAKQIALLRKQAVHKANPIRHFGDFEVKPSLRPLTQPETPKFETNKRFGKLSRI